MEFDKMILLDTHVLIWFSQNNPKLGKTTKDLILQALVSHPNRVAMCAISFWEIEMLVQKSRIVLPVETQIYRQTILKHGVHEIALDGKIGILANRLGLHGDPADRIIVATALNTQATLLTADEKILEWQNPDFPVICHNAKT